MTSPEPSYRMLAERLRNQILRGDYSNGEQLPTEAELATEHGLSRQTVRRAFQELVSAGMVYRIRGRGTFAQPALDGYVRQVGSVEDLMGLSDDTAMRVIRPLERRVDLNSAGRLRLSSDVVYAMQFARIHDNVPFCTTTVVLPGHVAKLLSDVPEVLEPGSITSSTIIGLLDSRLSFPIAEAQQSITVGAINEEDARELACEPGHPSLRVDRLYLDTNGDGVELATSNFLPEHYSYRISLRRSS